MDNKFTLAIAILLFTQVVHGVKIVDLKVPETLESGSEQNVILDCDYEVDKEDEDYGGLTVKWFYKDDTHMIYQWLPGNLPQAVGEFKGIVDLDYKASRDENTMHRALKIKELSPTLTGSYTCQVSSFASEDTSTKTMIIYKTANDIMMEHDEEMQTVNCTAGGLYPRPEMNLYIKGFNNTQELAINETVEQDEITGYYNITQTLYYTEDQLSYPTDFICEVLVPKTEYLEANEITYYPGGEPTTTEPPKLTELPFHDDYPLRHIIIVKANSGVAFLPSGILTSTLLVLLALFTLK